MVMYMCVVSVDFAVVSIGFVFIYKYSYVSLPSIRAALMDVYTWLHLTCQTLYVYL